VRARIGGDGFTRLRVRFATSGVEIRRHHGRKVWFLRLDEAVGILARAAQVNEANHRLGRKE